MVLELSSNGKATKKHTTDVWLWYLSGIDSCGVEFQSTPKRDLLHHILFLLSI
jgi:hypothetical protein